MKFQFLGTSAGEQYPAFWCECENCAKARRLGGRNIRKNSCAFLEPDCLLDLNHETVQQAERFGVPIRKVRYLLVTHSHEDHFSLFVLIWRRMEPGVALPPPRNVSGPRFSELPTLEIYGNSQVIEKLGSKVGDGKAHAMLLRRVQPFERFQAGDMTCFALPANHPDGPERGLNYIIQRGGKCILYALDTGWFLDETLDYICRFKYDLVVVEGTYGYGIDAESHMNFEKVERAYRIFKERGLLREGARFCVSHISPHFSPVHDELAPTMAKKGITIAYDGMALEV